MVFSRQRVESICSASTHEHTSSMLYSTSGLSTAGSLEEEDGGAFAGEGAAVRDGHMASNSDCTMKCFPHTVHALSACTECNSCVGTSWNFTCRAEGLATHTQGLGVGRVT